VAKDRRDGQLDELGLADTHALPADATIRANAPSEGPPGPGHLPRLSLDLRGSLAPPGAAPAAPEADLELCGILGEGGMGRVFLAKQHSIGREVAVKTVRDDAPPEVRRAILYEGAITGRLEHPAIVPVHALGVDQAGRPAMVMKRIEGVAWNRLLEDPAHPGWEGWQGSPADRLPGHVEILVQVCNAVHFAHSRGIIHRDVKPDNVLIGRFGDVYVADWGIALHVDDPTRRGICGTPGFMAPEMALGGVVDARTDVYLLGATLHAVLTGRPRHEGDTAMTAISAAVASAPFKYPVDTPAELAELCNRACDPDPQRRPRSAQAFRDAVIAYTRHRDSSALSTEASERVVRCEALAALQDPDAAEVQELDRLVTEVRFGIEQALRQWPDNPTALRSKADIDRLLEERRARTAELERFAKDRDPGRGARGRAIGITGLALASIGIVAFVLVRGRAPTPIEMAFFPAVTFVAMLPGAYLLRRDLLASAINRQAALVVFAALGFTTLNRVWALFVPMPSAEVFTRDCLIMASMLTVASFTVVRWAAWMALIMIAGMVAIVVSPAPAEILFGGVISLAVAVGAGFGWRMRRLGGHPRDRVRDVPPAGGAQ
jgi:eukaryotic-like serine/threonine-protein kinase